MLDIKAHQPPWEWLRCCAAPIPISDTPCSHPPQTSSSASSLYKPGLLQNRRKETVVPRLVMIFMAPVAEATATDFEFLYCAEDNESLGLQCQNKEEEEEKEEDCCACTQKPGFLDIEQMWDEEELNKLLDKEIHYMPCPAYVQKLSDPSSPEAVARSDAIIWILKVHMHYGFDPATAILSICYLDRFLSGHQLQSDQPLMAQLAAVACLSLAAKIEETEVPLLLDLQVEGAKHVFEPKTIQTMELLVLSTLDWRMTGVTALSFLDQAPRILSLKRCAAGLSLFMRRCKGLLLTALTDVGVVGFLPSVLAAAVMVHVLRESMDVSAHLQIQSLCEDEARLLSAIKAKKDWEQCVRLVQRVQTVSLYQENDVFTVVGSKRKRNGDDLRPPASYVPDQVQDFDKPGSPDAVLNASFSNGNCTPSSSSSSSSSLSSSFSSEHAHFLIKKKTKKQDCIST